MASEKEKMKEADEKDDLYSLRQHMRNNVWFSHLLPAAFCCIVYIADIATDVALVERHFADRENLFASITLLLIYLPPLVFLILTFLDEEKWPAPQDGEVEKYKWVAQQVGLFLFFPINAVYRFAGILFWSTEALLCPESQQEDCLWEASKPAYSELYLLLQAFFQAAPQAVFQAFLLTHDDVYYNKAGYVQAFGILTSVSSVGIAASCYMRYESQRLAGRQVPWGPPQIKTQLEPKESLMTTIESQITSDTNDNSPTENPGEGEEVTNSPKAAPLPKGVPQSAIIALPPLPPQIRARLWKATGDDELPEELQKHLEEDEKEGEALNIRAAFGGKSPNKELPDPLPEPPDLPAPPPPPPLDMFDEEDEDNEELPLPAPEEYENSNNEPDNVEENNEPEEEEEHRQSPVEPPSSEEPLSNEPLLEESTATLEIKPISPPKDFTTIPLPTRKWKVTGLAEDDAMGKAAAFVWWFFFVGSRVLTLAMVAHFIPWLFLALVLLHYLGMVSYLFYNDKSKEPLTVLMKLSLGFVYLFCIIEVRTKFKKPIAFTLLFIAVGFLENIIVSLIWYYGVEWDNWWYNYVFCLIVVGVLLSIFVMMFYIFSLKPNNVDIYED